MINKIGRKILQNKFLYFFAGKIMFKKYKFKLIKTHKINTNWGHLLSNYKIILSTDNLVAIIHSQNEYSYVNIEQTPHYSFINNLKDERSRGKNLYENYLEKYFQDLNIDLQVSNFVDLKNQIFQNDNELFVCVKKEFASFRNHKFKIIDGLHRASIAKHLSIENITCYIVDEIIS
tara:strand:+ start:1758 stop:2285 length:528 start_codon:yes stop_codon:yes gene_type:complete